MTPTLLFLTVVVIYLLAFIQYWIERPTMSPNERRHSGIVAVGAVVTAIILLLAIVFGVHRDESALRLGPWSYVVLAVPIGQLFALGARMARRLPHRRLPSL